MPLFKKFLLDRLIAVLLSALFLCAFFAPLQQAEALPGRVKVRLFSTHKTLLQLFVYGPVEILAPRHEILPKKVFTVEIACGGITLKAPGGTKIFSHESRIVLVAAPGANAGLGLACDLKAAPRLYRGSLTMTSCRQTGENKNSLQVINEIDTRSYITSCVGSECLPSFAAEALKAQAVLSTTLLDKNFHNKPIDDSTEEQSYLGTTAERPAVRAAVNEVFGEELYFNNQPIDVFFCSTCGGTTTTPAIFGGTVPSGRYPYLKSVHCPYCKDSPFFKEHREKISAAHLYQSLGIKDPQIVDMSEGRPRHVSYEKENHKIITSGYQFWLLLGQKFGWGFVPSTAYSLSKSDDHQSNLEFVSRGCGHGVGLCQWGAAGQAKAGRGYKEILYFYFPGTSLKNLTGKPSISFSSSPAAASKVRIGLNSVSWSPHL